MVAVRGSPPREQSLRPVHRQFPGACSRGPLANADADEERFVAVGRDRRDHAGEMRAERQREAARFPDLAIDIDGPGRSEEHTSELQSLMRISYAVFCLKKTNVYIHN